MEEPMELLQVRAVLFDMDGTLVTSDEAVERAWMTSADRQLAKARLGAHVELTDLHQLAGLLAG
jgi:beta-phosphoglucomutase-like phosphatase (HAD superfamily)